MLARAAYPLVALLCLVLSDNPGLALGAGLLLAVTLPNPYLDQSRKYSRLLLQISVVLLGFGMPLGTVLEAGRNGMAFAVGTIVASFAFGALLARWLGVDSKVSTLISSGTAICGGSAIAAVSAVIGANEGDMSVAMGTVFILNAVALYLFPWLGGYLHLTQTQFGVWAGVAIHDVSSVVGAAKMYGPVALHTGTAVKLARALWIFPVSVAAGRFYGTSGKKARFTIPWFIGLFFLASLVRFVLPSLDVPWWQMATVIAKKGLMLTLFLIGSSLSVKALKTVGWRPLLQGGLLWLMLGTLSLLVVLATVA